MRVTYHGPYNKELAEFYGLVDNPESDVYIGVGCNKLQAAHNAIKKMRGYEKLESRLKPIIRYIEENIPPKADFLEAPEDFLNVYCKVELYD